MLLGRDIIAGALLLTVLDSLPASAQYKYPDPPSGAPSSAIMALPGPASAGWFVSIFKNTKANPSDPRVCMASVDPKGDLEFLNSVAKGAGWLLSSRHGPFPTVQDAVQALTNAGWERLPRGLLIGGFSAPSGC